MRVLLPALLALVWLGGGAVRAATPEETYRELRPGSAARIVAVEPGRCP